MIDLGTLGGTIGTPNAMNNRGEVVGLSNLAGDQVNHPFLWNGEKMIDLGTFGGDFGQANWINEAGEVVGSAFNKDQELLAFLWKNGALINLGTLPADTCSNALGINSDGQVVGVSATTCLHVPTAQERHAFLWENGHLTDLNTFLPPRANLQQLTDAYNINDRGEIVGLGVPAGCTDEFACGRVFVLIPCDENHSDIGGCSNEPFEATTKAPVPSVRLVQAPAAVSVAKLSAAETRKRSLFALANWNRSPRSLPLK
jgi:probable HAF family extracellular repeat protein